MSVAVGQPAVRFGQYRAKRSAAQGETFPFPGCAESGRSGRRRSGFDRSGAVRRRFVRADRQSDSVERPAVRPFVPGLPAAAAADLRAGCDPEDIQFFGLPVPVQRDQLFQPEPGQTADR